MTCDICGRDGARERRASQTCGSGDTRLVIENVPVVACPHCGVSYMAAATIRELDRLRRNRGTTAHERAVAVATYP